MKENIRKIVIVLLALVFLGSAGMMIHTHMQNAASEAARAEAKALAAQQSEPVVEEPPVVSVVPEEPVPEEPQPVDDYAKELLNTDLAALRAQNPDVLGWISIPGTEVEYPLMDGEDNDFYLNHTWLKEPNAAGSIFLEQLSSSDLTDFNTIIYGHRMRNNSMFGSLKYYDDPDYLAAHPYVYIVHDGGCDRYEVFAAYKAAVTSRTYQYAFKDEAQQQAFLDHALTSSVIDTGIVPDTNDRVITLVTCTGAGYESRWVVQAVLPLE